MAPKAYPSDILSQATAVLAACKQINPQLQAGGQTQAIFAETLAQTQAIREQINALELQLTDLRNQRDERMLTIWDTIKRMRATVKGTYGDDSSEYELVGGKRLSDRKKGGRRSQA
jgi:hypothetical protein